MSKTLSIYYPDPDTGYLRMGFNGGANAITGVQVLLDKVALLLLNRIGSSVFTPSKGSELADRTNVYGDAKDDAELKLSIYSAIKKVESTILADQATVTTPDDEKLVSLEISDITQDSTDLTIYYVEVIVNTATNQSYYVTV